VAEAAEFLGPGFTALDAILVYFQPTLYSRLIPSSPVGILAVATRWVGGAFWLLTINGLPNDSPIGTAGGALEHRRFSTAGPIVRTLESD
jgi:hypothetical protein